jgi:hypothetical protein
LRNWVYARHGYAFTTPKAQAYFGGQGGYNRNNAVDQRTVGSYMNAADNHNKKLLLAQEQRLGCP